MGSRLYLDHMLGETTAQRKRLWQRTATPRAQAARAPAPTAPSMNSRNAKERSGTSCNADSAKQQSAGSKPTCLIARATTMYQKLQRPECKQHRLQRRQRQAAKSRNAKSTKQHRHQRRQCQAATAATPTAQSNKSCHAKSAKQHWLRRGGLKRNLAGVGHHARRPADTLCAVPPPAGADHRSPSHAIFIRDHAHSASEAKKA